MLATPVFHVGVWQKFTDITRRFRKLGGGKQVVEDGEAQVQSMSRASSVLTERVRTWLSLTERPLAWAESELPRSLVKIQTWELFCEPRPLYFSLAVLNQELQSPCLSGQWREVTNEKSW